MEQEEVWDAVAKKWAKFRVRPTEEVVLFLKDKKGKVLDLGCGSGRHCLNVEGLYFYGVDFSEKLLRIAREKDYVEVKKDDVSAISYDDEFFDFVVFARVLHCVDSAEKRRKSLEEIYRVLAENGEALIVTWGRKGCSRTKEKEGFSSWNVGGQKVERYTYVYNEDEFRCELEKVGFVVKSLEVEKNLVAVVGK